MQGFANKVGPKFYERVFGAKPVSKLTVMVPLNYWYKPLASTTETFVPGISWYKCVIGTKKQLVPRDY
jgi:hypothetical protein